MQAAFPFSRITEHRTAHCTFNCTPHSTIFNMFKLVFFISIGISELLNKTKKKSLLQFTSVSSELQR